MERSAKENRLQTSVRYVMKQAANYGALFSLLMISDTLIEPGQGHRGYCTLAWQSPL